MLYIADHLGGSSVEYQGQAWLDYDLGFHKDAVASGFCHRLVKNEHRSLQFSFQDPSSPIYSPDDTNLCDNHHCGGWRPDISIPLQTLLLLPFPS